mgnify:CR=1 FL=1|jgi:antitoxin component YwqK of YwqJK toxin-antitoxin module
MNKIYIFFGLFLLTSWAPNEVPSKNLVERDGIKYEVNSQTPFTGIGMIYHENGQLSQKGNYKDGKRVGLFEFYHENGQLKAMGIWKDGKREGLYVSFYENGQLLGKGNFKDGEFDGLWEIYHENGQLKAKPCYRIGEDVDISYCEK